MIYSSLLFGERENFSSTLSCTLLPLLPHQPDTDLRKYHIRRRLSSVLLWNVCALQDMNNNNQSEALEKYKTTRKDSLSFLFYFPSSLFFFRKRVKYFRINACNMPWDHSLYFCQFVWRWMETFSCETETTKMMMMMAGGGEKSSRQFDSARLLWLSCEHSVAVLMFLFRTTKWIWIVLIHRGEREPYIVFNMLRCL